METHNGQAAAIRRHLARGREEALDMARVLAAIGRLEDRDDAPGVAEIAALAGLTDRATEAALEGLIGRELVDFWVTLPGDRMVYCLIGEEE